MKANDAGVSVQEMLASVSNAETTCPGEEPITLSDSGRVHDISPCLFRNAGQVHLDLCLLTRSCPLPDASALSRQTAPPFPRSQAGRISRRTPASVGGAAGLQLPLAARKRPPPLAGGNGHSRLWRWKTLTTAKTSRLPSQGRLEGGDEAAGPKLLPSPSSVKDGIFETL